MKILRLPMMVCILPLLNSCDKHADPADDRPVLRVGATAEGYPHYYVENRVVKGFSAEILQAVADKIHYRLQWVTSDWVGVLGSLETGKVDTVSNFADTAVRRKKYDYTAPYYYSAAALAVSVNNTSIHALSDMPGKSVGAVLGSNYVKVLKAFDTQNKIKLVTFEGTDVIVSSVAQGKLDAYISGQVILLGQIKKKHLPLKIVGETFGEVPVAMPFRKDKRGEMLRAKVNTALGELRADGTLKKISENWFGHDLSVSKQLVTEGS